MTLVFVTVISTLLAAIMSAVAWHSSREERRRSDARIAALAAEIHSEPPPRPAVVSPTGDLFAGAPPARGGFRFATVVAAGLFVCGSAAALAVVSSNASGHSSSRPSRAALDRSALDRSALAAPAHVANGVDATTTAAALPIELVALRHEREGDRLTVRGIVRNPSSAAALDRVTAVVLLFKEDGGFLGSGRSAVESLQLAPGGETAFAITVPGASGVGRYRVSFRTDDRIVPHIDRRTERRTLEP